ncbi:MAG: MFS transporter [Verrucomicrobiales bacterium]|nr:MFS transporter [Verrucomicrobiales bacterium]
MPEPQNILSKNARIGVLVVAFLGWFFGGMQILITNLGMRAAALDMMDRVGWLDLAVYNDLNTRTTELAGSAAGQLAAWNAMATQWYAWFQCAFLFGAAAGGFVFGRLGDRIGRTRALGISVLWFSVFTGLSYFATSPAQLLVLRFLACLGIGGTWPNGVALVSEVWSNTARPVLASSIGMAGNLGIFTMATLAATFPVTPESWKWVTLVNASPVLLGTAILLFVPESPAWINRSKTATDSNKPTTSVFRAPHLKLTLVGIALATVPLVGGWGSANWMMPWADEIGSRTGDDDLKAHVGMVRSLTSIAGSLFAGLVACWIGRRRTYFLTSLGALAAAQYAFWFTVPGDGSFFVWVAALGLFNGIFFGWLPFFLPELFPTAIRSTGTGVSFNFGRILTAFTIVATGYLITMFDGDYAKIGRITSVVFLLGMVVVLFAPDTSKRDMKH